MILQFDFEFISPRLTLRSVIRPIVSIKYWMWEKNNYAYVLPLRLAGTQGDSPTSRIYLLIIADAELSDGLLLTGILPEAHELEQQRVTEDECRYWRVSWQPTHSNHHQKPTGEESTTAEPGGRRENGPLSYFLCMCLPHNFIFTQSLGNRTVERGVGNKCWILPHSILLISCSLSC